MGLFKSPNDKDGKGPGITLLQGLLILAVPRTLFRESYAHP